MSRQHETPHTSAEELLAELDTFMRTTQHFTQLQIAMAGAARFVHESGLEYASALISHTVEQNTAAISDAVSTLAEDGVFLEASDPVFRGRFSGIAFNPNQAAYQLYVAESSDVMHTLPYTDQVQIRLDVPEASAEAHNHPSPYA